MLALLATLEAQTLNPPKPAAAQEEGESIGATPEELRQRLLWLESQEHELAAKMHDSHPKLTAVREQIRWLKELLARQPASKATRAEAPSPSPPRPEEVLLAEKAQAESLTAREQALAAAHDRLRGEMAELNAQSAKIEELTQRVAKAEETHKEYTGQLEQARAIPTPERVQFSRASAGLNGLRTSLMVAAALAIVLLSSMISRRLAGRRKRIIKTARQLAAALGVPVTAVIPRGTFGTA